MVNKNVDDAKTIIEDAHFKVGKIEKAHDPNVPENCVISQDPFANLRYFPDTEINLVVSLGPEMVAVPDVRGKSRSEAVDALERAGFKVEYGEDEFSKNFDVGKICKQNPEGGIKAAKGSSVTIIISKGTESVQVPDVINFTEESAKSTLEQAGFTVRINREFSDKVEEGYVISQNPVYPQKLDKGSAVTIVVSKGSNEETVPYVIGLSVEQAKSQLQAAGFNVTISGAGTKVISTNPVSGNKVPKGSTITLNVG